MVSVYALRDPRDNEIRYIGRSVSPKTRLSNHGASSGSGARVLAWVRELKSQGLAPVIDILRRVDGVSAGAAERDEIHIAVLSGCQLLNTQHVPKLPILVGGVAA